MRKDLFRKYDVPVPRYTSYPTVPYWTDSPTPEEWQSMVKSSFATENASWSLYVHIPFCETLCTFCGCNTSITKDHSKESPYVMRVLREFDIYRQWTSEIEKAPLKHIHLGGGTPTFLAAAELDRLVSSIMKHVKPDVENFEGSIEVDPRRTTSDQIRVLFEHGFRRISLGVQDFDLEVQKIVNRVQSYEMTQAITETARAIGYESVNFDLIYGLPKQEMGRFATTIEKTIALRPDRIALYSFALVPWIKPAQRLFKDSDLPVADEKRLLYEMAYEKLLGAGYIEIGMDHFALPTDPLAQALKSKSLHRNFMGYSDHRTDILLGLGVSAISETPACFHQNEKVLPVYERLIDQGRIPTFRGHKLTDEDREVREQILQFMTLGEVKLRDAAQEEDVTGVLSELIGDGLVVVEGGWLRITPEGQPFLRNACMALDVRLRRSKPQTRVFSQAM